MKEGRKEWRMSEGGNEVQSSCYLRLALLATIKL